MPNLTLTPETAFEILLMVRGFDAKVPQSDPDSGSNPSDDMGVDALEFGEGDQTEHEIMSAISNLNDDEQRDLIALILMGRGDFDLTEWHSAQAVWDDIGRAKVPRFVIGIPLASDYLEEGLAQCGLSLAEYLNQR